MYYTLLHGARLYAFQGFVQVHEKMSESEALNDFEFTINWIVQGRGWVLQLLMNGRGDRNLLKPTLDSHLFKSRLHHWAPREIMVYA